MFLLFACTFDADTDADAADTDTDTDMDTDTDTGLAEVWLTGIITTQDSAFADGALGYSFLGLSTGASVCDVRSTVYEQGPAPDGCPSCDWAFDLGPVGESIASGSACEELGVGDGWADERLDYAWGYSSAYTYAYGGSYYTLEGALLVRVEGVWTPFARGSDPYVVAAGDTTEVTFGRRVISPDYLYYYY